MFTETFESKDEMIKYLMYRVDHLEKEYLRLLEELEEARKERNDAMRLLGNVCGDTTKTTKRCY